MEIVLVLNAMLFAVIATGIHDWRIFLSADLAADFI